MFHRNFKIYLQFRLIRFKTVENKAYNYLLIMIFSPAVFMLVIMAIIWSSIISFFLFFVNLILFSQAWSSDRTNSQCYKIIHSKTRKNILQICSARYFWNVTTILKDTILFLKKSCIPIHLYHCRFITNSFVISYTFPSFLKVILFFLTINMSSVLSIHCFLFS